MAFRKIKSKMVLHAINTKTAYNLKEIVRCSFKKKLSPLVVKGNMDLWGKERELADYFSLFQFPSNIGKE